MTEPVVTEVEKDDPIKPIPEPDYFLNAEQLKREAEGLDPETGEKVAEVKAVPVDMKDAQNILKIFVDEAMAGSYTIEQIKKMESERGDEDLWNTCKAMSFQLFGEVNMDFVMFAYELKGGN